MRNTVVGLLIVQHVQILCPSFLVLLCPWGQFPSDWAALNSEPFVEPEAMTPPRGIFEKCFQDNIVIFAHLCIVGGDPASPMTGHDLRMATDSVLGISAHLDSS